MTLADRRAAIEKMREELYNDAMGNEVLAEQKWGFLSNISKLIRGIKGIVDSETDQRYSVAEDGEQADLSALENVPDWTEMHSKKRGELPSAETLREVTAGMRKNGGANTSEVTFTPSGDLEQDLESVAKQKQTDILRSIPKSAFRASEGLKGIGVKITNSVGDYWAVAQMIDSDRAAKSVRKALRDAKKRLSPTDLELDYAEKIAHGKMGFENLPNNVNVGNVEELADYIWAEDVCKSDLIGQRRKDINCDLSEKMEILFGEDSDQYKVPSMLKMNERTPRRLMRTIFGKEMGEQVYDYLFAPVAANEAERIRFVNRMYNEVREFTGADGKSSALTKAESALVQQTIEGRAAEEIVAGMETAQMIRDAAENLRNGGDLRDNAIEFGLNAEERQLARQYSRWLAAKDALESGEVDAVKVDNAVEKFKGLFDQFYDAINEFLVAHGYEPIGFIKGYVPHMQPNGNQDMLGKALRLMGINADVTELPTNIAGKTLDYKPNKKWNPYFLSRNTDITNFDITAAYESYVAYMADVLYHTDDIMRIRAAERYLRKTYDSRKNGDLIEQAEDLRYASTENKVGFLRTNGLLDYKTELSGEMADEMISQYIEKLYNGIENVTKYGNLVKWMENYSNILAGKQSFADRGAEYGFGRESLTWSNRAIRIFAQSKVAGNLSSALNQLAQLPMIWSELGTKNTVLAIRDILNGSCKKAAWVNESDFLVGKEGVDFLVTTKGQMIVEKMFAPATFVDGLISTIAVRGKYLECVHKGMGHEDAMRSADRFAEDIMGSRAKGTKPLGFEAKNAVSQILHLFQVEAMNSFDHILTDLPADIQEIRATKGKKAAASAAAILIVKMLISSFVLNRLLEEVYGGTPAPFDILGLSANFIASGQGLTTNDWIRTIIDNGLEQLSGNRIFGTEDDRDGFEWGNATKDTVYNIMNDIPYIRNISGLLGLGDQTLPMPDVLGAGEGIINAGKESGVLSVDMLMAVLTGASEFLPGGRQLVKTAQGILIEAEGGNYSKGRLKYPVDGSPLEWLQAIAFGRNALNETEAFYTSGETALSEKQTQAYKALVDAKMGRKEAYKNILKFRKIGRNDEIVPSQRKQQQRDLIRSFDISDDAKMEFYVAMMGLSESSTRKHWSMLAAGMTFDEAINFLDESGNEGKKQNQFSKLIAADLTDSEKQNSLEEIMTETEFKRYQQATKAGIDTNTYLNFLLQIEGMKCEDVLSVINGLPISKSQKDALSLTLYKESTVSKKAPWRK